MRTTLLAAALLLSAAPAMAYDEDRALANTIGDYSSCAAFYAVGAACIARTKYGQEFTMEQMQEDAATWKSYENALQQSMQLMRADVAVARFKLYRDDMMKRLAGDCGNIAPLIYEHQFCKQMLEEGPEQRLEYWRAQH